MNRNNIHVVTEISRTVKNTALQANSSDDMLENAGIT